MDDPIPFPKAARLRSADDGHTVLQDDSSIAIRHREPESWDLEEPELWNSAKAFQGAQFMMKLLSSQLHPSPMHVLPIRNEQVRERQHLQPYQKRWPKFPSCCSRSPGTSTSTPDLEPSTQTSQTEQELRSLESKYRESHKQRKQCLLTPLKPLFDICDSDSSFILICRGNKHRCRVMAVKIPNSADDVTRWQLIHHSWYKERGQWRKHIRFFGVK